MFNRSITVLVSKKTCGTKISFKYFIGYSDNDYIKSLCIKLPQMTDYVKRFENNNKTVSLNINDKKPFEKYTKTVKNWKKLVA